jgi:predicted phosphodiesterase
MRIAVFSDIHANSEALQAVYIDSQAQGVDTCWFLGDAVGYGPDAVPAIKFIKYMIDPDCWVAGNHDAMFADLLTEDELRVTAGVALDVIQLHHRQIAGDDEAKDFCEANFTDERRVPREQHINGRLHTITHAGQFERHIFRYIYPWQKRFFLTDEFKWLQSRQEETGLLQVEWLGHTHVPMLVRAASGENGFDIEAERIEPCKPFKLDERLTIINPGSVGQPRDGDVRAAYLIFDSDHDEVTFRRVLYPWQEPFRKLNELMQIPGEEDETGAKLAESTVDNLKRRLATAEPTNSTPPDWLSHFEYAAAVDCNGDADV